MAGRHVRHLDRRDEDLVSPVDGEPTLAAGGVCAGLLDHRLQNGERGLLIANWDRHGQVDARLVVVLRCGERREPSALASGVVQRDAVRPGGQ